MTWKKLFLAFHLFALPTISYVSAQTITKGDWDRKSFARKRESTVTTENIDRRRVTIHQTAKVRTAPAVFNDELEFDRVRKARIDAKTEELIGQLETLIKREGQTPRKGELGMRLAELYYERGSAVAATESAVWEKQLRAFEALSEAKQKATKRPQLSTPKADVFRRKALRLYVELERDSRGGDHGASKLIRRDEVLYFLASTLLDLGSRAQALPHFEELVERYPRSERAFAARLTLADLFFEGGKYTKATSHYLRIAAGEGATGDTANLKPYAMYKLAWCYLNTSSFDKAVKAFQRTLELSRSVNSDRRVAFEKEALTDLAWAFALAGQYNKGEEYFTGLNDKETLRAFRKNASEIARDRAEYDIAKDFYEKLLKEDELGPDARGYAIEIADIYKRRGDTRAYAKALTDVGTKYSAGSDWLRKFDGSRDEKKNLIEEYVGLVRREAKALHSGAQKKDRLEYYQKARPVYEAYFKTVPEPNEDSKENLHEMRFYFGELLYKLEDYKAAATAYAETGTGKYGPQAAYARVVALKAGAKKDESLSKDLARATEDFVRAYPEDEKAGEILYSGAYDSFNAGQTAESIATLHKLVDKFSDAERGVESAERILFIYEKKNDFDAGIREADRFLDNEKLLKTGGKDFEKRLVEYKQKALFKKIEKMPEDGVPDNAAKAKAYLALSKGLSAEVKEKALNNANVYAKKGGDKEIANEAQLELLKHFPASPFAKDIYFMQGETAAKAGRWSDALKNYDSFLKAYKKGSPESEKALWNSIYIQAHLEDVALPRLHPARDMSADLLKDCREYLENFAKGPNRGDVLEFLIFRKGASLAELKGYERLGLSREERSNLSEAEAILKVRAGQDLEGVLKRNVSNGAPSDVLREALAVASFEVAQPKYKKYQDMKIDYKPARFAGTLQSKLGALEKLEKDYLRVVSFGNGELALKSLERLSGMYRTVAADIDRAPDATKDPQVKEELAKYSKPIFEKGVGFLRNCIEKAAEFKIGGAGLEACRSELAAIDPNLNMLAQGEIIEPRWVPNSNRSGARPLFKSTVEAFIGGRLGEFSLGASLLAKADTPMTAVEKAEIDNMMGLWNWRVGKGQAAAKIFREVSDNEGSQMLAVRTAAFKNLAALYMAVGDYAQATEILQTLNADDGDVAMLLGLSYNAQKKSGQAADAFGRALAKNKNNPLLTFMRAKALADSGNFAEAIRFMQSYVEREVPPAGHPSRAYLKKWKAMVK